MATQIRLRRDTAANWTASNPVLALGEPGIETNTRKIKYGDGTTAWTALAYSAGDVNFSGDYNDLTNKPTIPTSFDRLVNGNKTVSLGTDGALTFPDSATLAVGSEAEIIALTLVYTDYRDQLDAVFTAANYTGDGWPASFESYNLLVASVDPAIQPSWIVLAKNASDAYDAVFIAQQAIDFNIDIYGRQWRFTSDRTNITNSLTIPENTTITGIDNLELTVDGNGGKTAGIELDAANNRVLLKTTTKGWMFSNDGALRLPPQGKINNGNFEWAFNETGTLTVPSPASNGFILTFASTNYEGTGPKPTLTLTDIPWTVEGQYVYAANGESQLTLGAIGPNIVNPGYESGDTFVFEAYGADDQANHGIRGYTLTITLTSVVEGPSGWTATATESAAPIYPSTILTSGAVKLTTNTDTSWIFGTDGKLTTPGGSEYVSTGITQATDIPLSITLPYNEVISATALAGTGEGFLVVAAQGPSNDWPTAFGWNVNTGTVEAPVWVSLLGPAGVVTSSPGIKTVTLSGFAFVEGNTYYFRNDQLDIRDWQFSKYTLRTPGFGSISHDYSAHSLKIEVPNTDNIVLRTDGGDLTYGADGTLKLPAGGDIVDSTGASVLGGGATYDQSLNTTDNVTFDSVTPTEIRQNATRTVSATSVTVPGATPTVVYSAPNHLTSIKLVIAAEGQLDGDVTDVRHTQTCEATIAATYYTAAEPIISVYGIVYTSPAPLATFTVTRNTLAGTIEVTAINSQTTNALDVRVHAIQFVSRYD